jgi:chemotaxis protein histidine kinase CheA
LVAFGRFPRAVRELAISLGKHAKLELRAGGVQVDKHVLDRLGIAAQ